MKFLVSVSESTEEWVQVGDSGVVKMKIRFVDEKAV